MDSDSDERFGDPDKALSTLRVTICVGALSDDGKVASIRVSNIKDAISGACKAAGVPWSSRAKLFTAEGHWIDELSMIADGDVLVLAPTGQLADGRSSLKSASRTHRGSRSSLAAPTTATASGRASGAGKRNSAVQQLERDRDAAGATPRMVGPYRVLRLLGEGGFGAVRLGQHNVTGELAALKFLAKGDGLSASDADRIITEISCLTELVHPNIIHLQHVFNAADHMVIALDYAPGGDLSAYVASQPEGRLSETDASDKFSQIVKGVVFAHARKVVHRDLKLENILLGPTPGAGTAPTSGRSRAGARAKVMDASANTRQCLITDFGLSQYSRPGEVRAATGGSLYYMCPEIIKGLPTSGAAVDAWCLGVMLFALLTGKTPFRSVVLDATADRLREEHLHAHAIANKEVSPDMMETPAAAGGPGSSAVDTSPPAGTGIAPTSSAISGRLSVLRPDVSVSDSPASRRPDTLLRRAPSSAAVLSSGGGKSGEAAPRLLGATGGLSEQHSRSASHLPRLPSAAPRNPSAFTVESGDGEVEGIVSTPVASTVSVGIGNGTPTIAALLLGSAVARSTLTPLAGDRPPVIAVPVVTSTSGSGGVITGTSTSSVTGGAAVAMNSLPSGDVAGLAGTSVSTTIGSDANTSAGAGTVNASRSGGVGKSPASITGSSMLSGDDIPDAPLTPRDYDREAEEFVDLPAVVKEIRAAILAGISKIKIPRYVSAEAADLIRKLLTPDAEKRLSAQDVLAHPWFMATQSHHHLSASVSTGSPEVRTPTTSLAAVRALTSGAPLPQDTSDGSSSSPQTSGAHTGSLMTQHSVFTPNTSASSGSPMRGSHGSARSITSGERDDAVTVASGVMSPDRAAALEAYTQRPRSATLAAVPEHMQPSDRRGGGDLTVTARARSLVESELDLTAISGSGSDVAVSPGIAVTFAARQPNTGRPSLQSHSHGSVRSSPLLVAPSDDVTRRPSSRAATSLVSVSSIPRSRSGTTPAGGVPDSMHTASGGATPTPVTPVASGSLTPTVSVPDRSKLAITLLSPLGSASLPVISLSPGVGVGASTSINAVGSSSAAAAAGGATSPPSLMVIAPSRERGKSGSFSPEATHAQSGTHTHTSGRVHSSTHTTSATSDTPHHTHLHTSSSPGSGGITRVPSMTRAHWPSPLSTSSTGTGTGTHGVGSPHGTLTRGGSLTERELSGGSDVSPVALSGTVVASDTVSPHREVLALSPHLKVLAPLSTHSSNTMTASLSQRHVAAASSGSVSGDAPASAGRSPMIASTSSASRVSLLSLQPLLREANTSASGNGAANPGALATLPPTTGPRMQSPPLIATPVAAHAYPDTQASVRSSRTTSHSDVDTSTQASVVVDSAVSMSSVGIGSVMLDAVPQVTAVTMSAPPPPSSRRMPTPRAPATTTTTLPQHTQHDIVSSATHTHTPVAAPATQRVPEPITAVAMHVSGEHRMPFDTTTITPTSSNGRAELAPLAITGSPRLTGVASAPSPEFIESARSASSAGHSSIGGTRSSYTPGRTPSGAPDASSPTTAFTAAHSGTSTAVKPRSTPKLGNVLVTGIVGVSATGGSTSSVAPDSPLNTSTAASKQHVSPLGAVATSVPVSPSAAGAVKSGSTRVLPTSSILVAAASGHPTSASTTSSSSRVSVLSLEGTKLDIAASTDYLGSGVSTSNTVKRAPSLGSIGRGTASTGSGSGSGSGHSSHTPSTTLAALAPVIVSSSSRAITDNAK